MCVYVYVRARVRVCSRARVCESVCHVRAQSHAGCGCYRMRNRARYASGSRRGGRAGGWGVLRVAVCVACARFRMPWKRGEGRLEGRLCPPAPAPGTEVPHAHLVQACAAAGGVAGWAGGRRGVWCVWICVAGGRAGWLADGRVVRPPDGRRTGRSEACIRLEEGLKPARRRAPARAPPVAHRAGGRILWAPGGEGKQA